MNILFTIFVTFFAGMGAGLGTGFAGLSAAAVISPMLITFLHMDPYMAVGIALSSDVLASAVSAYTYHKNKNLDIKNGLIMMVSVLVFTVVGSWVASLLPSATMGSFSVFMTFLLGIKFIVRPVMTTKEAMQGVSAKKRAIQSIVCGILIGFICGFIGAGGGMMMLLILTSVLGYELKTAVGTSVFIMTFTALTGAVSHFAIGGAPDWHVWVLCVGFTLLWARIAAVFANKADAKTLNRATGIILHPRRGGHGLQLAQLTVSGQKEMPVRQMLHRHFYVVVYRTNSTSTSPFLVARFSLLGASAFCCRVSLPKKTKFLSLASETRILPPPAASSKP